MQKSQADAIRSKARGRYRDPSSARNNQARGKGSHGAAAPPDFALAGHEGTMNPSRFRGILPPRVDPNMNAHSDASARAFWERVEALFNDALELDAPGRAQLPDRHAQRLAAERLLQSLP